MSDYYDEDEGEVPEGGRFEPEPEPIREDADRLADRCRMARAEVERYQVTVSILVGDILEGLMSRRREEDFLFRHKATLKKAAVFVELMGSEFMGRKQLFSEYWRIVNEALDSDAIDPDAWIQRGYRTVVIRYATAALLVQRALNELGQLASSSPSSTPHVSGWMRSLYGLGPDDIPF